MGKGLNKKSANLNKIRTVHKRIREIVKGEFSSAGTHIPMKLVVKAFCDMNDIKKPASKKVNDWLIDMYSDQDCDLIQGAFVGDRNYNYSQWKQVSKSIIDVYGYICLCCGSKSNISIDHIKPYSKHPEMSLELNNLQPLCRSCNSSKGNRKETDYRPFTHPSFCSGSTKAVLNIGVK